MDITRGEILELIRERDERRRNGEQVSELPELRQPGKATRSALPFGFNPRADPAQIKLYLGEN